MSTVVKRSMKRTLLELQIKAANAKRDYYEKKKSLLSVESAVSSLKPSLTELKILENLKDEESAFTIEKKILQKQLFEAKMKASTSKNAYHEMKKSTM